MDQLFLVTWKSALIFFMLILLSRVIGRKLLSQMTYFDFIIAITIGTISGAYVVQMVEGMWVLLSPIILTLITLLFSYLNLKSVRLRKLSEGEPTIVMQNGKILDKNMARLRYTLDALEMQLREKGVFNFADVEFAVLEPHGELSVLKKTQNQPITPKDLNVSTTYQGLATELIKDGKVFEQNLTQNQLSLEWLLKELSNRGIHNVEDVMYASLNTDGSVYIDFKDDRLDYVQKVED